MRASDLKDVRKVDQEQRRRMFRIGKVSKRSGGGNLGAEVL